MYTSGMERKLRAVGYGRVSTDDQAVSGAGIKAQVAAIEMAVASRGWTLIETFVDEGVSGKVELERRPAFVEAITAIEDGAADILVVAKLDRLTRSVASLVSFLDRADGAQWSLVILDADVDTTTAAGRLVASVLGSVAEWERRVIGERTKAALATRRADGLRLGRPIELADETRQLIRELRSKNLSLRSIAYRLTKDAVPTARGGEWHASTVRAVLASLDLDDEAASALQARISTARNYG